MRIGQPPRLRGDRGGDTGMAMPEAGDGSAAGPVDDTLTICAAEKNALTPDRAWRGLAQGAVQEARHDRVEKGLPILDTPATQR